MVGINTPFETAYGPVLMAPLHPSCRCGATLIPSFKDQSPREVDTSALNDPELRQLVSMQPA